MMKNYKKNRLPQKGHPVFAWLMFRPTTGLHLSSEARLC